METEQDGALAPGNWIESNFFRRECVRFVRSVRDASKCACGRLAADHPIFAVIPDPDVIGDSGEGTPDHDFSQHLLAPPSTDRRSPNESRRERWSTSRNTIRYPTNAYGCIEFQGGPHPSKAQYIRLTNDTNAEAIFELFLAEWGLEPPKLLITIHGGKQNFDLAPKLKKVFKRGLLRAAKTTGAWLFTAGTNNGVTRHVGEALATEKSPRVKRGRVVSIGIAPWGVIDGRLALQKKNQDVPYHSIAAPRSKLAVLNNRHSHFLLVDNGTVGRYGCEIAFRRKLERYITKLRLDTSHVCCIPMVCVVVEGGPNTIRTVLEYVTDDPPVPVVICDGSGRAADVLAFAHRNADEDHEGNVILRGKEYFLELIMESFGISRAPAQRIMLETLECVRRRDMITVFSIARNDDEVEHPTFRAAPEPARELDEALLGALLKCPGLPVAKQLALVLSWDRVDIARSQIFVYGQEWPSGCLEEAMMDALVLNRLEFVKLLLENGVSMSEFLTIQRLEELYNTREGPANTLRYIVADIRPGITEDYWFTLVDIGLVLNKLMGGAFRSSYCRRKFRHMYSQATGSQKGDRSDKRSMKSGLVRNASAMFFSHSPGIARNAKPPPGPGPSFLDDPVFDYPFHDLMIWAVLTKRQDMALLMWQHGEEAVPKALVAVKLYKSMAYEAKDDDLELEVYEELKKNSKQFETRAVELMDYCYRQDRDLTQQLLTVELSAFSRMTCLSLAYIAGHFEFLSHPCPQMLLADLWLGGLRMRKSTNIKVILGLMCPLYLFFLDFKTVEELQLQPQTEEEYEDQLSDRSSLSSGSDSSLNSKSSAASDISARFFRRRHFSFRDQEFEMATQPDGRLLGNSGSPEAAANPSNQEENDVGRRSASPAARNSSWSIDTDRRKAAKKRIWQGGVQAEAAHSLLNNMPDVRNRPQGSDYQKIPTTPAAAVDAEDGSKVGGGLSHLSHQAPVFHGPKSRYRQLNKRQKIHEFYAAPVTKFWGHAMAYVCFLLIYSYMVLHRMPDSFSDWPEWYVVGFVVTFGCEKFRELLMFEPNRLSQKIAMYTSNIWNVLDAVSISIFMTGVILRLFASPWGRVFYCTVIMYWYTRILDFLSVNKYLGPFVTMIGRMVINMSYFVVLLAVMLMSFGVSRRSILFPDEPWSWDSVKEVFFQPYFMLYGEVFAPEISPDCGEGTDVPCHTGRWITPIAMTLYLLIANILLINLLIAVFNNIFEETNTISRQLWMYQRFSVVMEYEQKPLLPPPLIAASHVMQMVKFCFRKWKGIEKTYSRGLKLFLEKNDLDRVHDFEEECMDAYCEEALRKVQQSTPEQIKMTWERVERISQRVNDLTDRQISNLGMVHSLDVRVSRFEDLLETTLELLMGPQRPRAATRGTPDDEDSGPRSELAVSRARLDSVVSRQSSFRAPEKAEIVIPAQESELNQRDSASISTSQQPGGSHLGLEPRSRTHSMSRRRAGSVVRRHLPRENGSADGQGFQRHSVVGRVPSVRLVRADDDLFSAAGGPRSASEERDVIYSKESSVEPTVPEEDEVESPPPERANYGDSARGRDWSDEVQSAGTDPFSLAFGSYGSPALSSVDYCASPITRPAIQIIPPTPPAFMQPLPQEFGDDVNGVINRFARQQSRPGPTSRVRRTSESSTATESVMMENEALRQAESSHYHMMGNMIKRRLRGVSECDTPAEEGEDSPVETQNGFEGATSAAEFADLWTLLRQAGRQRRETLTPEEEQPVVHGVSMQNLSSGSDLDGARAAVKTKSCVSLPSLHGTSPVKF